MLFHTHPKYGSDRFRRIFIDHWEHWWPGRREELPADQRARVQKTVEKMIGCHYPQSGYGRYVCTECNVERICSLLLQNPVVPLAAKFALVNGLGAFLACPRLMG